jgi:hypothetical protein
VGGNIPVPCSGVSSLGRAVFQNRLTSAERAPGEEADDEADHERCDDEPSDEAPRQSDVKRHASPVPVGEGRPTGAGAVSAASVSGGSGPEQRLDGAAFVHRAVALRDVVEGQVEIEDLAGIDLAVPDEVDKLGQEATHRRGTAVQVDV